MSRHGRLPPLVWSAGGIPALIGLAAVIWWDYLTIVFPATWLAAIVWVILRLRAQGIALDDGDVAPSAAEAARRRLSVS